MRHRDQVTNRMEFGFEYTCKDYFFYTNKIYVAKLVYLC